MNHSPTIKHVFTSRMVNQSITQPRTTLQAVAQKQLIDAAREIGTVLIDL